MTNNPDSNSSTMTESSESTDKPLHKSQTRKNFWGFVFRGTITILILSYLFFKIHWQELFQQLLYADVAWLVLAFSLFGVVYIFAALRWWFLMKVQDIHLPFRSVVALTFIGQFFNSFMLGSVGGDIIKAVYLHKYAPNQKTHATLSIIMDRVLGLIILIAASLIVIPWQFEHLMRNNAQANSVILGLMIVAGLAIVTGLIMVVTPFHRAPSGVRALWHKIPHRHIIELVISGFRQHGVALHLTLASLTTGIIMTIVLVAAGFCIGVGIGLTVSYLQMLVIMTVVICVISLPISIGGHGVREGIFIIMFATFGVTNVNSQFGNGEESAILFSLLFFAIPLLWSFVGGFVYLGFRHNYDIAQPTSL